MTPIEAVEQARQLGIRLSRNGDRLRIKSDDEPPSELMAALHEHKARILTILLTPNAAGLTPRAQQLLEAIDQGGVMPAFISARLRQIAEENGVAVSTQMRPDDVIEALRSVASSLRQHAAAANSLTTDRQSTQEVRACSNCKQQRWWQRPDGGWVCGVCHPDPRVLLEHWREQTPN
jgi:hypothetical protein